jgi:hypothetical protein
LGTLLEAEVLILKKKETFAIYCTYLTVRHNTVTVCAAVWWQKVALDYKIAI